MRDSDGNEQVILTQFSSRHYGFTSASDLHAGDDNERVQ